MAGGVDERVLPVELGGHRTGPNAGGVERSDWRARLVRRVAPDTTTVARRAALVLIAGLAGLSYGWALGSVALEPYYEAAVRSMAGSWHDFIFGAFDPAGTVTLDKLPGAFWLQALSVRAFGLHAWAMVLPQVLEGAVTVLVLYRAVRRLAGPTAGLIAAGVLALSPATVALDRGNVADSLLVLLLVLAADAVSGAVATGSTWRLVLAAVFVGLAFQAKMIEAWMVLPALGLAYLLDAPGSLRRRLSQLAVAGAVAAAVSLSWMAAVQLVPTAQRPYVDGSGNDSTFSQVFVYNGFGRFGDQTPLQLLTGQTLHVPSLLPVEPPAPDRLLHGDLGRDTGWLLPAALVVGAWGVASRRRRSRGDLVRACFVLWSGWLLTLGAVFSAITTINPYYSAALSPAIAALLGAGAAQVLGGSGSPARRRVGLAILAAGSAGYAAWLVPARGVGVPGWLAPAALAAGLAAAAVALVSLARRSGAVLALALGATLAAGGLAPAVASGELVAHGEGAFDTPFEPAREAAGVDLVLVRAPLAVARTIPTLEQAQHGAPWLLATQTSALAALIIDESGREVLPIGGFTGTMPTPTLGQLQADVAAGRFHLVVAASSSDPRIAWIATHCIDLGAHLDGLQDYYCTPLAG